MHSISISKDLDTWLYVAIAIEARILELKHLEPTGRMQSLCQEQVDLLDQFASDVRKEILNYASHINSESRNNQ